MSWKKLSDRLRSAASDFVDGPILLDGDAGELLELLRAGAAESGIDTTSRSALTAGAGAQAKIVILAIESDGKRSSIMKAATMLASVQQDVAPDAVRIVVVQSGRSRIAPRRLQRLLATEILFEVTMAVSTPRSRPGWRSLRERMGLGTLSAAGLQVLRFG